MSNNQSKKEDSIESILLEELNDNGIFRLTLNDSKRRNALSEEMMASLSESINKASTNNVVRVIVIAANGPAFCAGHDLKQMSAGRSADDDGLEYFTKVFSSCSALMQLIVNHPKPIIAEVAGVAAAAGCQLVACCDLAVGGESSRYITPGINIGLFCSTPMVALSRNVNKKNAMEMLLTGEMVTAERAAEIGLVNTVIDTASLREHVTNVAKKITSKSSVTLAMGKAAFYAQRELSIADAYDYAAKVMVENMLHRDAAEGISAFIEKRDPKW